MHRSLRPLCLLLGCVLLGKTALAAPKPHLVAFGKWTATQFPIDGEADKTVEIKTVETKAVEIRAVEIRAVEIKTRPLYVDGRLKEFTVGPAHEITDRLFVVRRAFRLNDTLPQEPVAVPRWRWQRGGWLVVDRVTGHVSAIALPEFDDDYSTASWYRDYVAYCGISDDGKKTFAMVAQLGRRKPILKQSVSEAHAKSEPACATPTWQRQPVRVAFTPGEGKTLTYSVHGRAVDVVIEENHDEDQEEGTQ